MSICVVVADSSKARILLAENGHGALIDDRDFVHPESRLREQDLVSDGTGNETDSGGYGKHSMGHENAAHRRHAETSYAVKLISSDGTVICTKYI
jgi:hypothetical protein